MLIEVPTSEVIDRAGILQIKLERLDLGDDDFRKMTVELEDLLGLIDYTVVGRHSNMYQRLKQVNEFLWDAVAEQREMGESEDWQAFGEASVKVVRLNDSRFELKRAIDEITKSPMREFKE